MLARLSSVLQVEPYGDKGLSAIGLCNRLNHRIFFLIAPIWQCTEEVDFHKLDLVSQVFRQRCDLLRF